MKPVGAGTHKRAGIVATVPHVSCQYVRHVERLNRGLTREWLDLRNDIGDAVAKIVRPEELS
jgi:hypothetical protein